MVSSKHIAALVAFAFMGTGLAGCLGDGAQAPNGVANPGRIAQTGSSTVFPIAEAWAEELAPRGLQVTVGGGGSGRGASAICAGEADIGDMSRPMKETEIETCRGNGVEPVMWKVAFDGLTVVLNAANDFVDQMTVEELNHIWRQNEPASTWKQVRDTWPDETIVLYGPDADSGTYEYFNEEILGKDCGKSGKSMCPPRSDYTPSADDNVLVEGVAASKFAIGHFGFAYFLENTDRLRAANIVPEGGTTGVEPTFATIADGSYAPLGRPIFMVTNGKPAAGTPLHSYFTYAMSEGQALVRDVGYVELDAATLSEQNGWL